ncbi:MAG: hypothetical protein KTR13_02770 [Saprospiraceae bacterium]|nr:hypothetical protein [Saprospiraceae bacterium]
MMNLKLYFLAFFLFFFSGLLAQTECPEGVNVTSNTKCLFLSWDDPADIPNPLPTTIFEVNTNTTYTYQNIGDGTVGNPAEYDDGTNGNCSQSGGFDGEIQFPDGTSCTYTGGTVVPVELLSFSGSFLDNGTVSLNWVTASEEANERFEIERMTADGSFEYIGEVAGSGTTFTTSSYSFTDTSAPAGAIFYRLKQVDFGGAYEYSRILKLSADVNALKASVFKTNIDDAFVIELYNDQRRELLDVQFYSIQGSLVHLEEVNEVITNGVYQRNVQLDLPKGMYIAVIRLSDGSQSTKVLNY